MTILFKAIVLSKLLYAAPVWLNSNLSIFNKFISKVLLKISGSTHHPPKDVTELAVGLTPLSVMNDITSIKFVLKALQ